ncbi:MAG TPA: glutamate-5-semialdehyde dehydrogenase, partial [Saprospiraceae bacterium]|nr:glutamate-5-semialdehyde dehydrogenase [Saprospiraceae bacterium]
QGLLHRIAEALLDHAPAILAANQRDLARMPHDDPKRDRLVLNQQRLADLSAAVRSVSALPDPVGTVLLQRTLPNGLSLRKIAVPLGVVGVIYESRPNVTVDVAALCLYSGNAVALRGGSDAYESNNALVQALHQALRADGLPLDLVALLPPDRALVHDLLTATRYVDILIPRGSEALIQFVRENARVPVIETGAGVCHTYVHQEAHLYKARDIVVNAKVSRPSVCNALDTILVDAAIASDFLPLLKEDFGRYGVEMLADTAAHVILEQAHYQPLLLAQEEDFGREFLDYRCSVKVVPGLEEALEHISRYSSRHSEAIVSEDGAVCREFLERVDAAAVYANASTRFTDGGEFGLGAEIGISTQKLHARGPFALEKLVTEKWLIEGDGQTRW